MCKRIYEKINITDIYDVNICTTYTHGKGACKGDSGGPLVTRTGDFYTLIGVVSWVAGDRGRCGQYPGVYARVSTQLDWIKNHTSGIVCFKWT